MRHLFPWTKRRARRRALDAAQRRQRADYDAAVTRIVEVPCPYCTGAPIFTPGDLAEHIEDEHGSLLGESWR